MSDGARAHLPGLDGLRGIAVTLVVLYHLGYLTGGFVGVDLFFVLSGFLITTLLLDRPPGSFIELRAWWGRRVRRLTPAVAVVVVSTAIAFVVIGAATDGLAIDAVATLTWWQNWHLVLSDVSYWSNDVSPLRHAWSLAIEEQFYLLWPPILMTTLALARRARRPARHGVVVVALVGTVASFGWAAWLAARGADLSRIYFGTDTRVGALLIGCCAAGLLHGRVRARVGRAGTATAVVAASVLAALMLGLDAERPATYLWGLALAASAAVALTVAASAPGPVATALSPSPLQWLGTRSYAIYLWSWPLQVVIEQRWPMTPRAAVAACTIVGSLALAEVSLRLVERPMRLRSGWAASPAPRRVAWAGGTVTIVAAVAMVVSVTQPMTGIESVSAEQSADLALRPPPGDPAALDPAALDPAALDPEPGAPTAPPPTVGGPDAGGPDASQRLRLVLTGDSVAFAAGFVSTPEQLHGAGIQVADGRGLIGCWVLAGDGWSARNEVDRLESPRELCAQQREAEQIGLSGEPDWVVNFAGGWEGTTFVDPDGVVRAARSPELRAAILAELVERGAEATATGARIAWPSWVCPGRESDLSFGDGYASWFNEILADASSAVPGSIVIEPTDVVCVDADPDGAPTAAKDAAWEREHHPHDGGWLWQEWLGPALWAAEGRPNPG